MERHFSSSPKCEGDVLREGNGRKVPIKGNTLIDCGAKRSAFENGKLIDMTGRAVYSQDL